MSAVHDALYDTLKVLWSAVLCGHPTDRQKKIYEDAEKYKVGDLVYIDHVSPHHDKATLMGTLIKDEMANMILSKDTIWDIEKDGPYPQDRFWTIRTFEGNEVRWYNVAVRKIPNYMNMIIP